MEQLEESRAVVACIDGSLGLSWYNTKPVVDALFSLQRKCDQAPASAGEENPVERDDGN
jgi:hypothetical protein